MRNFLTLLCVLIGMCSPAIADPFYVGAYGGLNLGTTFEDDGSNGDLTFTSTPEAGTAVGIYAGAPLAIMPGVSAELDVNWRNNQTGGTRTLKGNTSPLTGNDSTWSVLGNLRYTHDLTPVLSLYALGGVGYGSRRITFEPVPNNFYTNGMGADRSGFVWQVGAGADYAISDTWKVGLGYRFFAAPSVDRIIEWGCEDTFFEARGDNHFFGLSTTYTIN